MNLSITPDIAHDAVEFALALANTDDPAMEPRDRLTDPEAVRALISPYLESGETVEQIAKELVSFRDCLRACLQKVTGNDPIPQEDESRLISALNVSWVAQPNPPNGGVACFSPQGGAFERLTVWATLGYLALRKDNRDRLRICEAKPCEEIFYDGTKPGRQRFCSRRCANRYNVAQYRSRQNMSS